MYKLIDTQGTDAMAHYTFATKEEVREHLQNYHSADHDTTNWTLEDCLEIGEWELIESDNLK